MRSPATGAALWHGHPPSGKARRGPPDALRAPALRALRLLAATAAVVLFGACDPGLTHRCTTSTQCVRGGEQGACEVNGRCSFGDLGCDSGRRYSEWAGEVANQCVPPGSPDGGPDGPPPDAGPDGRSDAPPPDAPPDAPVDADDTDA